MKSHGPLPRLATVQKRWNPYLRGSCSWRAGPGGRPGWAQPPPSRRCPDARVATRVLRTVGSSAVAASSPGPSPTAAEVALRVDDEEDCEPADRHSAASAASQPAVPPPTSTDRRHPTGPDDTLRKLAHCSPPGGFRHPPAVVRTASIAPV